MFGLVFILFLFFPFSFVQHKGLKLYVHYEAGCFGTEKITLCLGKVNLRLASYNHLEESNANLSMKHFILEHIYQIQHI